MNVPAGKRIVLCRKLNSVVRLVTLAVGLPTHCVDGIPSHGTFHRVFACSKAADLEALSEWPGLKMVLATENIRSIKGRRGVTAQIRYFLSSRPTSDKGFAEAIRRHWTTRNGLHWVLNVTFDEDQSRIRNRTAAGN